MRWRGGVRFFGAAFLLPLLAGANMEVSTRASDFVATRARTRNLTLKPRLAEARVLRDHVCSAPNPGAGLERSYEALSGLKPREGTPDYLRIRTNGGFREAGFRCKRVPDRTACLAALETLWNSPPLPSDDRLPHRLLAGRGDRVELVDTWKQLGDFLGPLDAPGEAALVATLNGWSVDCASSTIEPTSDGWLFTTAAIPQCEGDVQYTVAIGRTGAVTLKDVRVIRDNVGARCPQPNASRP